MEFSGMMSLSLIMMISSVSSRTLEQDISDWAIFKAEYNKTYGKDEEAKRFACFQTNMVRADLLDQREPDASFGITKFSGTCPDEWKKMQGFRKLEENPITRRIKPLVSDKEIEKYLAQSIDWRKKGAVSDVKDQGHCGSCWSFSCLDAVEGAWVAQGAGNLTSLSSQELVDCTVGTMGTTCPGCKDGQECLQRGCQGGDMHHALMWVIKNHGVASWDDYPYTSGTDPSTKWCKFDYCTGHLLNPIASTVGIAKDEGQILAALVSGGPLSISVDASDLQHYKGGIMRSCSSAVPDHGVGLVGYELDGNGKGYWIVKNSWNSNWGEKGYFRAEYGSNQCDLNNWVNQALVKKA